ERIRGQSPTRCRSRDGHGWSWLLQSAAGCQEGKKPNSPLNRGGMPLRVCRSAEPQRHERGPAVDAKAAEKRRHVLGQSARPLADDRGEFFFRSAGKEPLDDLALRRAERLVADEQAVGEEEPPVQLGNAAHGAAGQRGLAPREGDAPLPIRRLSV